MFKEKVSAAVLKAIENSPIGIAPLDILESLQLCDKNTLKTTLSRLNTSGKIIRLKRGVYSTNPMKDAFACAQSTFNGYLGFTSALYIHKLITEVPFTITVVTLWDSGTKAFGQYLFKAVSLKEKAIGVETKGSYFVSTRVKTLFDCIYLPRYAVEEEKLIEAFRQAKLTAKEWKEFDHYVEKFASAETGEKMKAAKKAIIGD